MASTVASGWWMVLDLLLAIALAAGCGSGDGEGSGADGGGTEGDCPRLVLSATAGAWDAPEIGAAYEWTFAVSNGCQSGDPLYVSIEYAGDAELSHSPTQMLLDAGEEGTLLVTFFGDATGTYEGALDLATNDPLAPLLSVPLSVEAGVDLDGDGFGYEVDCDDDDAAVHPGAAEVDDRVDQDCDGVKDEDFLASWDVVITEMLVEPTAVDDADGEWIELLNRSTRSVDLEGWRLLGSDGNEVIIDRPLSVAPDGFVVLGPNADAWGNGGVEVDFAYDFGDFWLLAGADDITIEAGEFEVSTLHWDTSWSIPVDASLGIDPEYPDPASWNEVGFWCPARSTYGMLGMLGTPGQANDDCTGIDGDGDGFTPADGDCDDTDPAISPAEAEKWDGIDNDCNGKVDDVTTDAFDDGEWRTMGSTSRLGSGGTSIADFDGDGWNDVALGTPGGSAASGIVYIIDNADAFAGGDPVSDAVATVTGTKYSYFGELAAVAGDQTGDGVADLLACGLDYKYSEPPGAAVAMFAGGSGLTGSLTTTDDATWSATQVGFDSAGRVEGALDIDGDGHDEVLSAWADADYGEGHAESGIIRYFVGADLSGTVDLDDHDAVVAGADDFDYLGTGLGGGDINGDGYDDIVAGAAGSDGGSKNSGAWYVIPGSVDLVDDDDVAEVALAVIFHAGDPEHFGGPARPVVADFDDDGKGDIVLGSYEDESVYVFSNDGSLTGTLTTSDATATITGDIGFGFGMAGGDVDGDGATDLLIGEVGAMSAFYLYHLSGYLWDDGVVFLFDGAVVGAGGDLTTADVTGSITGASSNGVFGASIAMGDLDADDKADFAVTAPRTLSYSGSLYVLPAP